MESMKWFLSCGQKPLTVRLFSYSEILWKHTLLFKSVIVHKISSTYRTP